MGRRSRRSPTLSRSPSIALVSLALTACSGRVELALPVRPTTESVILAVEEGGVLRLDARPARLAPGQLYAPLTFDADVELTALLYDLPLDALELEPGPIPVTPQGRPLPDAESRWRTAIHGDAAGAFVELPALDGALLLARIPRPDRAACLAAGGCYPGLRGCVVPCPAASDVLAPAPVAAPEPVRDLESSAAIAPRLAPCPAGWIETPATDPSPAACAPFAGPTPTCDGALAALPGERACVAVAGSCPSGPWADGLPSSNVIYVRAGAVPGDGSRARPYATLGAALTAASPGATIALAAGTYAEQVLLDRDVSLVGACAEARVLGPGAETPALRVLSARVSIADLTIEAPPSDGAAALAAGAGAHVELAGVVVRGGAAALSASDGAVVTGHDLVLRGGGLGLRAASGAEVVLARAAIEGATDTGASAEGPGTVLELRDVLVRGAASPSGSGVASRGAVLVLERALIEGGAGLGVHLEAGTSTLTDVVVRGPDLAPASSDGDGVRVEGGARVHLARAHLGPVAGRGLHAAGAGTAVELAEVWIDRPGRDGLVAERSAALSGARVLVTSGGGNGVALDAGASAALEALALADLGAMGLVANGGSRAELTRLWVTRVHGNGLVASASELAARDLVIDGVEPLDGWQGDGVVAGEGARLELSRARIEAVHEMGVHVFHPATTASLADVFVRDTRIGAVPVGAAFEADGLGALEIARLRAERSGGHGVVVSEVIGAARLTDVAVSEVSVLSNGEGAEGVLVQYSGDVVVERIDVSASYRDGLVLHSVTATVTDARVHDVLGAGVAVRGSAVTLARVQIPLATEQGLLLSDETVARVVDLDVERTRYPPDLTLNVSGLRVKEGARAEVERLRLIESAGFGASVETPGVHLRDGVITGNDVGVRISAEGVDPRALADGVRVFGNGEDLRLPP